jgi:hypothetical protein
LKKEEFIKKANIIHNYKYNYELLPDKVFVNVSYEIICPIHGVFRQKLSNHINKGIGCWDCFRGYPLLKDPINNMICTTCCKEKPKSEFRKGKSQCKECEALYKKVKKEN